MTLAQLDIILPIDTYCYYWNKVQICNALVYIFNSWKLYYDMTFATPIIYFFSDLSGKSFLSASKSEEDESLENVNQV